MVKNPSTNAGDTRGGGLVPEWGRPPGGGNGNPLQCSCLENPTGSGGWQCVVHGATQSRTRLCTHTHTQRDLQIKKSGEFSSDLLSFILLIQRPQVNFEKGSP